MLQRSTQMSQRIAFLPTFRRDGLLATSANNLLLLHFFFWSVRVEHLEMKRSGRLPESVIAEIITYVSLPSLLCKGSALEVNRDWHAAARKASVKLHQVLDADKKIYIKGFARMFHLAVKRFPLIEELQLISLGAVHSADLFQLRGLRSLSIVRIFPQSPAEAVDTLCTVLAANSNLSRLHLERWDDSWTGQFQRIETALVGKMLPTFFNGCTIGLCPECQQERFLWPRYCFSCKPVQHCRVGCGPWSTDVVHEAPPLHHLYFLAQAVNVQ